MAEPSRESRGTLVNGRIALRRVALLALLFVGAVAVLVTVSALLSGEPGSERPVDYYDDAQLLPDDGSVVFQRGEDDCGIAALATLFRRLGIDVPYAQLAQRFDISREGVCSATIIPVH